MIDPRQLINTQLAPFDPAIVSTAESGAFDEYEPLLLEHTRLTSGDIDALRDLPLALDGCAVAGCDLSNLKIYGIKNSIVTDTKLRGTRFHGYVRNVVFEQCQFSECTLRMSTLEQVDFKDSALAGCDFYGSELTSVSFPGSEIQGVGFDQCTLNEVDLTQATDLRIGDPRTLTGAALCETQVPLIAARLAELSGIEVRDC